MKKTFKISIFIILFLTVGLFLAARFFGTLMADEDNHIDLVDLVEVFEDGDLIFQSSKSPQSKAIQIATDSKYSHLGIIYKVENKLFVYEAIQPVKLTLFEDWVNRGEKGHFVVKRLKNSETILTSENILKLKTEGEKYLGKNYDLYFEWSDDRIYCSELVWKMYKEAANIEIGKLQRLGDFNLTDKLVQHTLNERYGNNIPMEEYVISPSSMFESEKLQTVYEN